MSKYLSLLPLPLLRTSRAHGFVQILLLILILLGVTTYGVAVFQSKITRDKARQISKNADVLNTAKESLLDFAFSDGLHNYQTRYHILPALDYFDVNQAALTVLANVPYAFRVTRPGQLPCPDVTGADAVILPTVGLDTPRPAQLASVADQNLDGVADYGYTYCSAGDLDPLVYGSRYGRLPWAEYFDYTAIIRGVDSPYPLIDRNGDRLWYAVSRNVVDIERPINPHRLLREDDGWLTLAVTAYSPADEANLREPGFANELTISNIAALVISPGTPGTVSRQYNENQLYAPGVAPIDAISVSVSVFAAEYLDSDNNDADLNFVTGNGSPPGDIDRITHISREELVTRLDRTPVDGQLDRISDALANYYDKYGSLPDPASAESASTDFIFRSFGSRPAGTSPLLYDPDLGGTVPGELSNLATIGVRGGRVEYRLNPISPPIAGNIGGLPVVTPRVDDLASAVQLVSGLSGAEVPDIFVPVETALAAASTGFHNFDIPLNNLLYPAATAYTPSSALQALASWDMVIPAGEPFRAAAPFYVSRDPLNAAIPPPASVDLTASAATSTVAYNRLSGDYQLLFGDLRPGTMRDVAPLGYAVLMPSGTWMVSDSDITISGTADQLIDPISNRRPQPEVALTPNIAVDATVQFGVSRDLDALATEPPAVAAKTPLVAGNHGLLPTPLLPIQPLPLASSNRRQPNNLFALAQLPVAFTTYVDDAVSPATPARPPYRAMAIDPLGAIGSFPAEVTLHSRINSTELAAIPLVNTIEPEPFDPANSISGPAYLFDGQIAPHPFFSDNMLVYPSNLVVDGPIVVPVGAKFFYPRGMQFHLDGRLPDADGLMNLPVPQDRLFAHLPTGTVLHDVRIQNSAGSRLPDGQLLADVIATAPQVPITVFRDSDATQAAQIARVTLVNGGRLSYRQLAYYENGALSSLPQNRPQAAFRVEGKFGFTRAAPNVATINSVLSQSTPGDFIAAAAEDAYLYPALGVVDARAQRLAPAVTVDVLTVGTDVFNTPATVSSDFEVIENPLARAELVAYNFGNAATTVTVAQADERTNLTSTFSVTLGIPATATIAASRYALVDQFGLGIELLQNALAAQNTVLATNDIELDFGRGVTLQANPGRLFMRPDFAAADGINRLDLNQFGSPEGTTPLVLSYQPSLLSVNSALEITNNNGTSQTIDARMSEIALHLDGATTVGLADFGTATGYDAPSDRLALAYQATITVSGTDVTTADLSRATRAIARFDTETLLYDPFAADPALSRYQLPVGTRAEFGLLEYLDLASDTRHMLPGARIFSGAGFYPIPTAAAVRPFRDAVSVDGPATITLTVRMGTTSSAGQQVTLQSFVRTAISAASVTLSLTANNEAVPTQTVILDPDSHFVLTNPRLALAGGRDAEPFERVTDVIIPIPLTEETVYNFSEGAIFFADVIAYVNNGTSPPTTLTLDAGVLPTRLTTVSPSPIPITIALPFDGTFRPAPADVADVAFSFVLDDGGIVTDTVTVGAAPRPRNAILPRQVMRMRFAVNEAVAGSPDLLPLIDLSWSDRERNSIEFSDFAPDSLVFAQNNPMFYAVADVCRSGTQRITADCTTARQGGLSVQVLAGEQVRLPEDEVAPPGTIIHGFGDASTLPQPLQIIRPNPAVAFGLNPFNPLDLNDALNVTLTVDGVRIREDGALEQLAFSEDSISSLSPANTNILDDPAGSTLVLLPGENGVMFRYAPRDQSTYPLSQPAGKARRGHLGRLTLIQGGFTAGNESNARHRITVAVGQTMTLASDTLLVGSYDIPEQAGSIELAPGSVFNLGGGTSRSGSNYRLISEYSNLTITLGGNAILPAAGQQLATVTLGGSVLELNPTDPALAAAAPVIDLVPGTVVTITGANRALQAHVSGSAVTLNISSVSPSHAYSRLYHHDTSGAVDLATPTESGSTPLTFNDLLFNYGPSARFLSPNPQPVADVGGGCVVCGSIDISALATSTVGGVFEYPPQIIIEATLAQNITTALRIGNVLNVANADALAYSVVTLEIPTTGAAFTVNSPVVDVALPDTLAPEVPGALTLTTHNGGTPLADFYEATVTIQPGAPLTFALSSPNAGIALDRFGATEPILITIGSDLELSGPLAFYSSPNSSAFAIPGVALTNAGDEQQEQLFIDDPDTVLRLTGDYSAGIQLTDENLAIDGRLVPAGSILYPRIGRLLLAQDLPIDVATPIASTLGVIGNIVSGSAAGRPRYISREALITLGVTATTSVDAQISYIDSATNAPVAAVLPATDVTVRSSLFLADSRLLLRELDTRRIDGLVNLPSFDRNDYHSLGSNIAALTTTIPLPTFIPPLTITNEVLTSTPAVHQILFPNDIATSITLHPPPSRSSVRVSSYELPIGTTLQVSAPTDADGGGVLASVLVTAPPDSFTFTDRIDPPGDLVIDGQRFTIDVSVASQELAMLEQDRIAAFSEPVRQYLWLRIATATTITNTVTNEEQELPANTVINPLLGTYLSPQYRYVAQVTVRIGSSSPAIAGSQMVFTRPALVIPRGASLDVGDETVTFADVKGLIAHSPQPLRRDVGCSAYPGGPVAVNQLTEGRSTGATVLLQPSYDYAAAPPGVYPSSLSRNSSDYGHPCLLLDVQANTDLDKHYVFTSQPLHDTTTFDVVSNDRMRLIGGKLQL